MTSEDILKYRLHNQHLATRSFKDPADVVRYMGAVQAQDFAAAKWALGLRLEGKTEEDVEKVFNSGEILRTHLMRPTWHFVAPEDIRWLLMLTAPRVKAQCAFAYRYYSLTDTICKKSNKIIAKALAGGKHLTRDEIATALNKEGIDTSDLRLIHLLMRAELDSVICSGPKKGKLFTYALLEERVPPTKELTRDEALAKLATQYFKSHGPATLPDFVWWSGLTMTDAKAAMAMVSKQFISEQINGQTYRFASSLQAPKPLGNKAHLLPNYDEYTVAYKDHSNLIDPKSTVVTDARGSVIFNNTILLNGKVSGIWKRTIVKDSVEISITPFLKYNKTQEQAITTAVKQYGKFMNKTPLRIS